MQTFIAFVFVIGVLILCHEIGHFIVAKRVGIRVEAFGIGFGPPLFSLNYKGTVYRINAIFFFGGYVKLAGEEDNFEAKDGFNAKPVPHRILVVLAGSCFNFILALIIFCVAGMVIGIPTEKISTVVWRVLPGSEAQRVGLKPGDKIIEIDKIKITSGAQMIKIIHSSANKKLRLKVLRNKSYIYLSVVPREKVLGKKKVGLIGFNPKPIMKKVGFYEAIYLGLNQTYNLTVVILKALPKIFGKLFRGKMPEEVGGPIAIYYLSGQAASFGFGSLMVFIAMISINIGLINLFPFPGLDGGRFIFLLVEAIRGKRIDPEKENLIHLVGFVLLMILIVLTIYGDLLRFLPGKKVIP